MSKQTISTITDKVLEGMAEWQNRPLGARQYVHHRVELRPAVQAAGHLVDVEAVALAVGVLIAGGDASIAQNHDGKRAIAVNDSRLEFPTVTTWADVSQQEVSVNGGGR